LIAIKKTLDKILRLTCALLFLILVFLNFYQVFTRYVLNSPSTISEELLGYLVVWLTLLGAALVFGYDGHIKVPIIYDKLTGIRKLAALITIELIVMLIAISVFIIGGISLMEVGTLQISPTLNITLDWIYMVLPISGVLTAFYNVVNIITAITNYNKGIEVGTK
jgi:TRAP-type C4-dicarboxylate transport system permease small subunit